jgi:alpha-tubulin suppressor-like RCC1 family protein
MKKKYLFCLTLLGLLNNTTAQCLSTIDSGNYFILGRKSNGTIWGVGSNMAFGQLGDGTETDHYTVTQLSPDTSWQQIRCGDYYAFAIKNNGTLWGTGNNNHGQLGIGSTISYMNTFTQVGTATNWKQIATGNSFVIALKTDGTMWGWGQNNGYQMGNASCCSDRRSPAQIGTATDWKMVEASDTGTGIAIKTNGTIWGWGSNSSGIIGNSLVSSRQFPTQLNPDTDWATMSVGVGHILALKTNGTLWSWGGGGYGENGDMLPPTYFRDSPVQIGTDTWSFIATGYRSSYGIKPDGTLWAWGLNDKGQLGDGTTVNRMQPVQIGTDTDWASVAGGLQHAVGLKTNGALWTWGLNYYGQLGNGTTTDSLNRLLVTVPGCSLNTTSFEQNTLLVSPNPAREELLVQYQGNTTITGLRIYDITGRVVYSSTPIASNSLQATLPIASLQTGTYLLQLQANNTTVLIKRFVKE